MQLYVLNSSICSVVLLMNLSSTGSLSCIDIANYSAVIIEIQQINIKLSIS